MADDNILPRLLAVEKRAEAMVDEAERQRADILHAAGDQARRDELRFESRIPEIHADFVNKAEARARQAIAELELRYNERTRYLRDQAAERREEAISAALDTLLR
ncbi:MAG: ATPase [Chromatiales bacterium]|nr:ATPase [Gammaproteobacteria bacterium]MCP5351648.1 ATPase [Chromatiales bacterium]